MQFSSQHCDPVQCRRVTLFLPLYALDLLHSSLESTVLAKFQISGLRHVWKTDGDIQAHSLVPAMQYRNLGWRLGAAGAGSIQTYPIYKFYPDWGWDIQDNWGYSVTPQSILNTHKPLWGTGGWVGKGNLPGSETATSWPIWARQGVAAGLRDRDTLWVGFLFTQISCCPQHLPPPASMSPRHRIWQSFAGLQYFSCLLEPGTRLLSLRKQQAPHFGLSFLA